MAARLPGPVFEKPRSDIDRKEPHAAAVRESVLDAIGGTPLFRLARLGAGLAAPGCAKAESPQRRRQRQGPRRAPGA